MRLPVAFLAACMLATGTLNTISTKIQDTVVVGEDAHGRPQTFKHPVVQTACMFGGECLCLVIYLLGRLYRRVAGPPPAEAATPAAAATTSKRLGRTVWAFALPALCDSGATTLLNLGLYYTYASVFQMLRGTLVVFAGALTIGILKRRLHSHHWLGMVLIVVGAALVGASSLLMKDPAPGGGGGGGRFSALTGLLFSDGAGSSGGGGGASAAPNPLLGNTLVVLAQVLNAMQFILEEKYLVQYRAPVLLAVGLEGAWGLVICALATPFLSQIRGPDGLPLDSFGEAFAQIRGSATLQWTTAATVLSIGLFNFFGVSVTKKLSGAARATIDACRTLFVWFFCLWAGWERFHLLQVVGFVILLSGTSTYNEILRSCLPAQGPSLPQHRRHRRSSEEEGAQEPLLGREGSGRRPPPRTGSAAGREEEAAGSPGFSFAPDAGQQQQQLEHLPTRAARPPLPARPRPISSHMSMARSVTILPGVLSPRSLASPSIGFESLRTNGEALGSSSEEEGSSGSGGSDSEVDTPSGAGEQQRGPPAARDRRASG